jgi:hypothetical protein
MGARSGQSASTLVVPFVPFTGTLPLVSAYEAVLTEIVCATAALDDMASEV